MNTAMRILIADDDPVSRKMLDGTLRRWDFETVVCTNGREALAMLQTPGSPDLAILDWMMPEIDGVDVCRQLRESVTQPKYIILLTAKVQTDDVVMGLAAGADDYVTKPFNPRELRARVNAGVRILTLQNRYSEKVQALEVALARLDQLQQAQKLEAIGRLASGVAHEINTPMQYISGNISFLQEMWESLERPLRRFAFLPALLKTLPGGELLSAELDEMIRTCELDYLIKEVPVAIEQSREGSARVAKIVAAMQDFSHPREEEKTPVDIHHLIDTMITIARNEWKYVAEVVTDFAPNMPYVHCFPGEIQQVILILLINASEAIANVIRDTGSRGKIVFATSLQPGYVEIRVSDTGCGIPVQIQDKVFEPFFTTKEVGKGTGQGLSCARSVVAQRHGGKIWFTSEPGMGTTFFVQLPIKSENERKESDR